MLIRRTSPFTGVTHEREIAVDPEHYAQWQLGAHIQRVMPYLSDADREFIKTGITPEEWAGAFKDINEDVE